MSVLDFFVRPPGTAPPLQQPFILFGRISFLLLLNTAIIVTGYLYLIRKYYWTGYAIYIGMTMILTTLDGITSNRFGNNIRRLRKAGYSDSKILQFMEFNRIASQLIAYVLIHYVIGTTTTNGDEDTLLQPSIYTIESILQHLFDLTFLLRVGINLALTEILFLWGHSLTHTIPSLTELHAFHHCSVETSWNTNLLFHPIDLAIEFTAPALALLVMHYTVWKQVLTVDNANPDALLLYTYIVFQLWYAYDHDEHLQLHHSQHHVKCDSLYGIYGNWGRGQPANNLLNQSNLMKRGLWLLEGEGRKEQQAKKTL